MEEPDKPKRGRMSRVDATAVLKRLHDLVRRQKIRPRGCDGCGANKRGLRLIAGKWLCAECR